MGLHFSPIVAMEKVKLCILDLHYSSINAFSDMSAHCIAGRPNPNTDRGERASGSFFSSAPKRDQQTTWPRCPSRSLGSAMSHQQLGFLVLPY